MAKKYKYELPTDLTEGGLKRLLGSLGLKVDSKQVKVMLKLSHRQRRATINSMLDSEQKAPLEAEGPKDVELLGIKYTLGDVIDGKDSFKTYHVFAVCPQAMVCLRALGERQFKVKFYNNERAAGLNDAIIDSIGGTYKISRGRTPKLTYTRIVMVLGDLKKLWDFLEARPNMSVLPFEQVLAKVNRAHLLAEATAQTESE